MNEISGRMNTIIIKGLLVSSNDTGTHVREIFTIDRLESLVGVALEEYIFEEVSPDIQKWFFSEHCNLGMCTNVISAGDAIYSCLECQQHDMCVLCENCFMSSQHVNHDCQSKKAKHTGQVCSCGVKDLWKCHSTCTSHSTPQIPTKELPASFMSKFKLVVQYFCELLEKVCNHDQSILDKHVEKMVKAYFKTKDKKAPKSNKKLEKNESTELRYDNAHKSCLIVFKDEVHNFDNYVDCFFSFVPMSHDQSKAHAAELQSSGYTCIQFMADSEKCKKTQISIERCPRLMISGRRIKCRSIKVYRLYLMRLAIVFIRLLNRYCWHQTKWCDLLSQVVFKETSLILTYMMNEHNLWRELRFDLINGILLTVTFSEIGRSCMASLFLEKIGGMYFHSLDDHFSKFECFLGLTIRFMVHPNIVMYLVENEFLTRILDVFSELLKSLRIKAGVNIIQLYIQSTTERIKMERVLRVNASLIECLRMQLDVCVWTPKFKYQLSEAGKRLAQFCFDFDDIQPLKMDGADNSIIPGFDYLLYFFGSIYTMLCRFVKWLIFYDDVAVTTLEAFLERFTSDIQAISKQKSDLPLTQRIVTCCNIKTDAFSIFNLSHRVFVDILMDCLVKGTLPRKTRDKIFEDENMLLWIGRPAITTLSFASSFLHSRSFPVHGVSDRLIGIYFKSKIIHYLYIQDFNMIQILISHLDPDFFIKYMLFNLAPSIRNVVTFSRPLSSILGSIEFQDGHNLRYLLIWIYNALVERHFIGVHDNPEYQLLERQIIHLLPSGCQEIELFEKNIFVYREIFASDYLSLNTTLYEVLGRVAFLVKSRNENEKDSMWLKTECFNTVNMFYFMYNLQERIDVYDKLGYLYRNKLFKFQVPDPVELRTNFDGMNSFLLSEAFSDIIIHVLVSSNHNNGSVEAGSVENLLLVSNNLCLMLKISLNKRNYSIFHKTADVIFGIRRDLADKNVITHLAFLKRRIKNDVFDSIFDHLLELSRLPIDYFSDLSERPSDMTRKSKECRDLALKNLQNRQTEILQTNPSPQIDKNELLLLEFFSLNR